MAGRLSIVATPIGCLEDITLRGLRVLKEAELILAEDTRHTRTLCARHGIDTPLRSFHAHSSAEKITAIVESLTNGAHYALVSDAGTPLVSDPGAHLVSIAARTGVAIEAIPGPSAVLAALCVAGLPVRRFTFEGFLARGGKERRKALERIRDSEATVVFFESPRRIHATLRELEAQLGEEREVAVCRELTKLHEETVRGTLPKVRAALSDSPKGEITVVVEARRGEGPIEDIDLRSLVDRWKHEGLTTKEMAQRLREDFGWKRNVAYQAVLEATSGDD
ncbi:MAG: 16S rRNA (cytidine(1402)-2'-O)-methyltransferase [Polyangiales bacterium]|jgi:16S rRNA (cytidine1402-2'-O)-methyltransferase